MYDNVYHLHSVLYFTVFALSINSFSYFIHVLNVYLNFELASQLKSDFTLILNNLKINCFKLYKISSFYKMTFLSLSQGSGVTIRLERIDLLGNEFL